MPRNDKRLTNQMAGHTDNVPPERVVEAAKAAFAKSVWNRMLAKGWSQADLARHSGLGRDVIHSYVNAKSLPNAASAAKLASALGITIAQLYPGGADAPAVAAELPAVRMENLASGEVFLQINMKLPQAKALRLLALLQTEDV